MFACTLYILSFACRNFGIKAKHHFFHDVDITDVLEPLESNLCKRAAGTKGKPVQFKEGRVARGTLAVRSPSLSDPGMWTIYVGVYIDSSRSTVTCATANMIPL